MTYGEYYQRFYKYGMGTLWHVPWWEIWYDNYCDTLHMHQGISYLGTTAQLYAYHEAVRPSAVHIVAIEMVQWSI